MNYICFNFHSYIQTIEELFLKKGYSLCEEDIQHFELEGLNGCLTTTIVNEKDVNSQGWQVSLARASPEGIQVIFSLKR